MEMVGNGLHLWGMVGNRWEIWNGRERVGIVGFGGEWMRLVGGFFVEIPLGFLQTRSL